MAKWRLGHVSRHLLYVVFPPPRHLPSWASKVIFHTFLPISHSLLSQFLLTSSLTHESHKNSSLVLFFFVSPSLTQIKTFNFTTAHSCVDAFLCTFSNRYKQKKTLHSHALLFFFSSLSIPLSLCCEACCSIPVSSVSQLYLLHHSQLKTRTCIPF